MTKHFIILILFNLFYVNFIFSQIDVRFNADTTVICEGGSIQFTDNSIGDTVYNWHWTFGDGGIDTVQNPLYQYNVAGDYTVSLTASSSNDTRTKIKTNYIKVRKFPDAAFTFTDTMFLPSYLLYFHGFVLNKDDLQYNYYWNFNQTNYQLGDTIAIYAFPSAEDYIVSLIVEAGKGCKDTVFDTLSVKDLLETPNIFSPNGDGVNDVFIVKSNGANLFEIDIFNRWGAIVYSQTAKRLQWDGRTSAGVQLPCGTYFYHISSPDIKGYRKAGAILLVK